MNTLNVVESVFFTALEKETAEARTAYLDQACAGDQGLRRVVERMLNAHPKAENFLRGASPELAAPREESDVLERPGSVIGPYKLLQELGAGGFGVVFLAEQVEPIRRKVALKIIKPGMDSKQVVARFEAERQALALMDHPNIARVLDGGVTNSQAGGSASSVGRPYFVMELVKGAPITTFCDQNRLSPRERLELFVPVCNAVHHAHQKGIIHRDLKPSNVLVTMYDDKPVPKVIDFGIAKAIEQKLTEQTLFTRVGQVVGTLEYMSPEQASLNALDVDTRADVYALGVLLYELLTGTTPLNKERLEGVAFLEMLRLIREEEPPKPSTRLSQSSVGLPLLAAYRKTESQKLPNLVKGELDWITMKALEKDRGRRYAAASALGADVQRYLNDEQVEACPPTLGYRFQKYLRKHKALLGMVGAAAALLLAGIVATSWQAIRARQAEQVALTKEAEATRNEQIAQTERLDAQKERAAAQKERDAVRAAREELRRTLYANSMNLIQSAWEADNVVHARDLLKQQLPRSDEEDLRGFEWHYWNRLCNSARSMRTLDIGEPAGVLLSGDGSRLVTWHSEDRKPEIPDDAAEPKERAGPSAQNAMVVRVFDIKDGQEIRSWRIKRERAETGQVCINHDGRRLAFVHGVDNPMKRLDAPPAPRQFRRRPVDHLVVWDVASGKEVHSQEGQFLTTLAMSPDGRLLATVEPSSDRDKGVSVNIRDLSDSGRAPVLIDAGSSMGSLVFSGDGSRIAVMSQGSAITAAGSKIGVWDTSTGKSHGVESQNSFLSRIAFSPDGKRIFAVGVAAKNSAVDRERRLASYAWELTPDAKIKLLRATPLDVSGANSIFESLAINPDGRRLAVALHNSSTVRILEADTGVERQLFKGVSGSHNLAFSPDGLRLVDVNNHSLGLEVNEYDVDDAETDPARRMPKFTQERPAAPPTETTVRSADGRRVAVYRSAFLSNDKDARNDVSIRDVDGKVVHTFAKHEAGVIGVAFSPSGRLILSRDRSGAMKIWETDTGIVRWSFDLAVGAQAKKLIAGQFVAKSPRGLLVLPGPDGIKVVNFDDLEERFAIGHPSEVALSPNGGRLVAVYAPTMKSDKTPEQPGAMKLWDVDGGRELLSQPMGPAYVHFLANGERFVTLEQSRTASSDCATFWNAVTGAKLASVDVSRIADGPASQILSFPKVLLSPDGKRVVLSTGMAGSSVRWAPTVFDVATGAKICSIEGYPGLAALVFSPDGKRIATAGATPGRGEEIKLWDSNTGRELLSLKTESTSGLARTAMLRFSPDGHRLTYLSTGNRPFLRWDATPRAGAKSLVR